MDTFLVRPIKKIRVFWVMGLKIEGSVDTLFFSGKNIIFMHFAFQNA